VSTESLHFAGVVLITVPAVAFGGVRLLRMIFRREPGYLDNPVQPLGQIGLIHQQQSDERENHQYSGVGVTCPPEVLAYLVPLGGLSLSVGAVTLGLGLLSA
jgi:hypothetical protein